MCEPDNRSCDSKEGEKQPAEEQPELNYQPVRLFKPRAVVLGFHGTIAPVDWEDHCIAPYVQENLLSFLKENWSRPEVMSLIFKLRDLSFDQHFVFETAEAPLIIGFDMNYTNWLPVVDSVHEFIQWQMKKVKISKEALLLIKQCWTEGYQKKRIRTVVFEDVRPTLQLWRQAGIQVAVLTPQMSEQTCRMVLRETTAGDLTPLLDRYFDPKTVGERSEGTYHQRVAAAFNMGADWAAADILLITDYGQDAKLARQHGYQSVIMVRPGNRKTRSYYLIRFPFTNSLKHIEFIEKK